MSDTQHNVATVKAKSKAKWLKEADKCMLKRYGIGIVETGNTENEFYDRWADNGDTSPDIAVKGYGDKYDLIDFEDHA